MGIAKRLQARAEQKTKKLAPSKADRVLQWAFASWVGSDGAQGGQATLFDVPSSSKTYHRRNKAEIREWLKTDEGQKWFSDKVRENCAEKAAARKLKAEKEAQRLGLSYNCAQCIHGIGKNCPWNLPGGCKDYIEVHTGNMLVMDGEK
jgi:hypothetical protein